MCIVLHVLFYLQHMQTTSASNSKLLDFPNGTFLDKIKNLWGRVFPLLDQ